RDDDVTTTGGQAASRRVRSTGAGQQRRLVLVRDQDVDRGEQRVRQGNRRRRGENGTHTTFSGICRGRADDRQRQFELEQEQVGGLDTRPMVLGERADRAVGSGNDDDRVVAG